MPSLSALVFLGLAALTLGSAGLVAFSRNIIHSALALLGTFLGIAGLYVSLSADFIAATQVLVYVGGTLVLILFAVMLTSRIAEMKISNPRGGPAVAFGLVTAVLLLLGRVATPDPWPAEGQAGDAVHSQARARVPRRVPAPCSSSARSCCSPR